MALDDEDLAILKAALKTAEISKFKISRFGSRTSVNGNLQDRIVQYRHVECQDLRDRIFSLLGLLHPSEQKDLRRLFPDYSLTARQVFALAAAHMWAYSRARHPQVLPSEPFLYVTTRDGVYIRPEPDFFLRGCNFGGADADLESVLASLQEWYRCEWTQPMPLHRALRKGVNLHVIEHQNIGRNFLTWTGRF